MHVSLRAATKKIKRHTCAVDALSHKRTTFPMFVFHNNTIQIKYAAEKPQKKNNTRLTQRHLCESKGATSDSIHLVLRQYCSSTGLVLLTQSPFENLHSVIQCIFFIHLYSFILAPWESLLQSLTSQQTPVKNIPFFYPLKRKKETPEERKHP